MTTKKFEKFKEKSDFDLLQITKNPNSYQKEAVLVAIFELETRGVTNKEITALKESIQLEIELNGQKRNQPVLSKIPSNLPKEISIAAKMIYVSIALGVLNPIIGEFITEIENLSNPINLAIILFSSGVLAFFGYNINLGKDWARITYSVLTGLGLLMFPLVILETFKLNPIIGILSLSQAVLQFLAIFFLFKTESKIWYKKQKEELNKNTDHDNVYN